MNTDTELFRPKISEVENKDELKILKIMESCWREDPEKRPTMNEVKRLIKIMNKGR